MATLAGYAYFSRLENYNYVPPYDEDHPTWLAPVRVYAIYDDGSSAFVGSGTYVSATADYLGQRFGYSPWSEYLASVPAYQEYYSVTPGELTFIDLDNSTARPFLVEVQQGSTLLSDGASYDLSALTPGSVDSGKSYLSVSAWESGLPYPRVVVSVTEIIPAFWDGISTLSDYDRDVVCVSAPMAGSSSALRNRLGGAMRPVTGMLTNKRYGGFRGKSAPMDGVFAAGELAPPYALFSAQMSPMVGYMAGAAYLQPPRPLPRVRVLMSTGSTVAMSAPKATLSISAATSKDGITMVAPVSTLVLSAGASAVMSARPATLSVRAFAQERAKIALTGPTTSLSMQAQVEGLASMVMAGPSATLSLASGGRVVMVSPAGFLAAQATVEVLARFTMDSPAALLQLQAASAGINTIELRGPALVAGSWASAVMTMPIARLRVEASTPYTVVYEAYAVNLRTDLEGGGNEVTRYTGYPFERIVRWRDSYYGMAADGLYLLNGTDDDGDPIEWALRTGTTDFNKPEKKNTASAYVGGRLGPDTTFTVFTGEKSENQYAYTTPRGATAQNYRQKFGRGLDARYYAFQMEGSGELEMDDLTFEVVPRTRRI